MTSDHSMRPRSPRRWCWVSEDSEFTGGLLAPVKVNRSELLGRFLVGPLALLWLAVVLVFYVLYQPNIVEGNSMYPALRDRDRVLVTHGLDQPRHGQIVVFDILNTRTGRTERLIKRIIALPGDSIDVERGIATVNGAIENTASVITDPRDIGLRKPYVVPDGTVFVMGDNRPVSLDSRQLGPIRLTAIEGEVAWIWAPIHRIGPVR